MAVRISDPAIAKKLQLANFIALVVKLRDQSNWLGLEIVYPLNIDKYWLQCLGHLPFPLLRLP
ncbi:hypothetical protein WI58_38070 [Burkholderia cepacia]|nr:hypothetical protein WI48_27830 [Burkholderia cepacia]KVA57274.1 hypothetical protein WI49_30075 [Burkholderia cepacia]KVA76921.1 hypothetical protein WI50_35975 [Burkholderia cepacia]KVA95151.1 hypothetical protein WI52_36540 [Burkholderia cepacia]KVA97550.1 hypothetical protein WI51_32800 [Burkholderia cepacia]